MSDEFTPEKKRKPSPKGSKAKKQKTVTKRKPSHFGRLDNNEIETPENLLEEIRAEFGEFFDPCPFVGKGNQPDFDGKVIEWKTLNYVNPPYNDIEPWIVKAIEEGRKGKTSLLLVPVRTGTRYWEKYIYPFADQLRFLSGRIIFKGYDKPSPHHLVLIVFKPNYRIYQSPPPAIVQDFTDTFDATKLVKDKQAQRRYPELSVICASMHKTISAKNNDLESMAYKNKWLKFTISLQQLLHPSESDTQSLLHTVCLPLFYQMCCFETKYGNILTDVETLFGRVSLREIEDPMPLVALLRGFKPMLMCNQTLSEILFKMHSVLPSSKGDVDFANGISVVNSDWYKDAVGFYNAYADSAREARAKPTRSAYSIPSEDGAFKQNVTFL